MVEVVILLQHQSNLVVLADLVVAQVVQHQVLLLEEPEHRVKVIMVDLQLTNPLDMAAAVAVVPVVLVATNVQTVLADMVE